MIAPGNVVPKPRGVVQLRMYGHTTMWEEHSHHHELQRNCSPCRGLVEPPKPIPLYSKGWDHPRGGTSVP